MSAAYLTVQNVADRFQVSARTIQRLIERGDLQAVSFGPKLLRIPPSALEMYEANLCPTTDLNGPLLTENDQSAGTSSGPKRVAAIVSLQRRMTR